MKTDFVKTDQLNWLRVLNRLLPLNHRYFPIVAPLTKQAEWITIPSKGYQVYLYSDWARSFMVPILRGLDGGVPDFYLVADYIKQLKEGYIFDVGANIGCWSMLCAKYSSLPIVAFEPEPDIFKILERNITANNITTVQPLNLACANENSTINFHRGMNGYTLLDGYHDTDRSDHNVITVQGVTIDSLYAEKYVDQKVAFIKIDVEGFDWHVLQGAKSIIEQQRPGMFVEIHPPQLKDRGKSAAEVLAFLENYYQHIDLYRPQPHLNNKLANFFNSYKPIDFHLPVTRSEFADLVNSDNPPIQIYAICKP